MITVVFLHVLFFLGIGSASTKIGSFGMMYMLPLFFFVSGYFAYLKPDMMTRKRFPSIFSRKIKALILCTFVFYTIFQWTHDANIFAWTSNGFSWFWFTIALFQMYIIYYSICFIREKLNDRAENYALLFILIISIGLQSFGNVYGTIGSVLHWYEIVIFIQFFILGIICRKYEAKFIELINKNTIRTFIIASGIILTIIVLHRGDQIYTTNKIAYSIIYLLERYALILTLFIVFYQAKDKFESTNQNFSSKVLTLIGRRTLDIYMLHVFFLPTLRWMGPYLIDGGNMMLIQLTVGLLITFADIAVCLAISNILRSSGIISNWLFGVKYPKANDNTKNIISTNISKT